MSLCDSQSKFNEAFAEAYKENREALMKKNQAMGLGLALFILLLLIWAVNLSLNTPKDGNRLLRIIYALIASPAYILAHYLNKYK